MWIIALVQQTRLEEHSLQRCQLMASDEDRLGIDASFRSVRGNFNCASFVPLASGSKQSKPLYLLPHVGK